MSTRWERISRIARERPCEPRLVPEPNRVAAPSTRFEGAQAEASGLSYWRVERELPAPDWRAALDRALEGRGLDAQERDALEAAGTGGRVVFWDLETCGFSGNPLFLSGLLLVTPESARIVQCLARDYAEERAVIQATCSLLGPSPLLVTFNGKSYDLPFLRERAARFGVPIPRMAGHIDLLHAARRRWRHELEDCRLKTLERRLGKTPRHGDPPGREVPERYHRYVRERDPGVILPVLRHNRLDLATLPAILGALSQPERAPIPANLKQG